MEEINSIYTILVAIITILGSAAAWNYYENRAKERRESDLFIKNDCKDRIDKLEILLERASIEKDEMRKKILELTASISKLEVKVSFLENENERLKQLK